MKRFSISSWFKSLLQKTKFRIVMKGSILHPNCRFHDDNGPERYYYWFYENAFGKREVAAMCQSTEAERHQAWRFTLIWTLGQRWRSGDDDVMLEIKRLLEGENAWSLESDV